MLAYVILKTGGTAVALDPNERYYIKLKAAYLYYHEDITQQQLADQLGISRLTLNKLLKEARDEGIVKIEIQDVRGYAGLIRLENELRKRFGLKSVKIASSMSDDPASITQSIARAAAAHFDALIASKKRIGIGWGKTLELMSTFITPSARVHKAEFITLIGGSAGANARVHANTLADMIARLYKNSVTHPLNAPIYFENESLSAAALEDPNIRDTMDKMNDLDIALVGVDGELDKSTTIQSGIIQAPTIETLRSENAAGNICARFYDIEGSICAQSLYDKLISIPFETLKAVPTVIAVAGGSHKIRSLIGAARGGYYNTLITDEHTAKAMLDFS